MNNNDKPPLRRVTSIDVAERAGVSQSTVSRALSGSETITEATRRRVELAAEQLGYHVNARAAGLRRGETGTIAIVVIGREGQGPAAINPFYYSLLGSTCAAAAERGYEALVSFQARAEEFFGHYVARRQADGVVVIGTATAVAIGGGCCLSSFHMLAVDPAARCKEAQNATRTKKSLVTARARDSGCLNTQLTLAGAHVPREHAVRRDARARGGGRLEARHAEVLVAVAAGELVASIAQVEVGEVARRARVHVRSVALLARVDLVAAPLLLALLLLSLLLVAPRSLALVSLGLLLEPSEFLAIEYLHLVVQRSGPCLEQLRA